MSNTLVELKLECLKLAYDTFHKTGGFSTARVYKMEDSPENLMEDVKEVFALSDMNFKYIQDDLQTDIPRCVKCGESLMLCGDCRSYEDYKEDQDIYLQKKLSEKKDE